MFNSDVLDRIAVGVDLANAHGQGLLPGTTVDRPAWIFEAHGYLPPSRTAEWSALTLIAEQVARVLHLVADDHHQAAIAEVNQALSTRAVTPFIEARDDTWVLHLHTPDADFAEGWAAGVAAALAISYSTADADRVGRCDAPACSTLFLDRGRNRQRRFCSLRCQNRSKSTTYRRRRGGP